MKKRNIRNILCVNKKEFDFLAKFSLLMKMIRSKCPTSLLKP